MPSSGSGSASGAVTSTPALADFTAADYIALILAELNASDSTALAAQSLVYWELHADKGSTALRYLYVKRSALDFLLGLSYDDVTTGGGSVLGATQLSDKAKALQKMRADVTVEIARLGGCLTVATPTVRTSNPFITTTAGEFG